MCYDRFLNWAQPRAAMFAQRVLGESVSLPAPRPSHTEPLARRLYDTRRPS